MVKSSSCQTPWLSPPLFKKGPVYLSQPIGVGPQKVNWVSKEISSGSDDRLIVFPDFGKRNRGSRVDEAMRRGCSSQGEVYCRKRWEPVLIASPKVHEVNLVESHIA